MSGESSCHAATIMAKVAAVMRDSGARITNIESVLATVGVSVREISLQFGGTRELILAMTSELADRMSAPLDAISMSADLRQRLLGFGGHVYELCATSHWRGLYRIAVTEAIRKTGLAGDFHEAGLGRLTQRLAAFLRMAQEEGALAGGEPHLLASHFLSALFAELDPCEGSVTRSAYVRSLVDLFCHGSNRMRRLC